MTPKRTPDGLYYEVHEGPEGAQTVILVLVAGQLLERGTDGVGVFYAALGIILGGRLGYVLFYNPAHFLQNPAEIVQLWKGGMSFHGGIVGGLAGKRSAEDIAEQLQAIEAGAVITAACAPRAVWTRPRPSSGSSGARPVSRASSSLASVPAAWTWSVPWTTDSPQVWVLTAFAIAGVVSAFYEFVDRESTTNVYNTR